MSNELGSSSVLKSVKLTGHRLFGSTIIIFPSGFLLVPLEGTSLEMADIRILSVANSLRYLKLYEPL